MKSTTRLRELLQKPGPIIVPGAFDAFSAKLMQNHGFSMIYLGGLASATTLCTAEPLLDMTEQVGHARLVAAHLSVPLIVDGHTGFGDPVHITRAVREFEAAGIAGIHLEDVGYPKRVHYFKGIKHVVPVETMLARLHAAQAARRDPDFVIIARTDAYGAVGGSLEEAIRRLEAYRDAGADARVRESLRFGRGLRGPGAGRRRAREPERARPASGGGPRRCRAPLGSAGTGP